MYAAGDVATAVAEVFQLTRRLDVTSGAPYLTGWSPARSLRLLDLTGDWAVRNGAAHALNAAPRPVCRTWARAISAQWPDLDGLLVTSTMTGRRAVVLWVSAADSFPDAPGFSRPLTHPDVHRIVTLAAATVGYRR